MFTISKSQDDCFLNPKIDELFEPLTKNIFDEDNDILFNPFLQDQTSQESETNQVKQKVKFTLTKLKEEPKKDVNFLQKKLSLKRLGNNEAENDNSANGRWDRDEQKRFAEAILYYGNDWKKIQEHVGSRNSTQVRSHAQKFLMKLKENEEVIKNGLNKNLSWTKAINYLNAKLPRDVLEKVLFSVEQNSVKKQQKKIKKAKKKENEDSSNSTSLDDSTASLENELDEEANSSLNEESYDESIDPIVYGENNTNSLFKQTKENDDELLNEFIQAFGTKKPEESVYKCSFEADKDSLLNLFP